MTETINTPCLAHPWQLGANVTMGPAWSNVPIRTLKRNPGEMYFTWLRRVNRWRWDI